MALPIVGSIIGKLAKVEMDYASRWVAENKDRIKANQQTGEIPFPNEDLVFLTQERFQGLMTAIGLFTIHALAVFKGSPLDAADTTVPLEALRHILMIDGCTDHRRKDCSSCAHKAEVVNSIPVTVSALFDVDNLKEFHRVLSKCIAEFLQEGDLLPELTKLFLTAEQFKGVISNTPEGLKDGLARAMEEAMHNGGDDDDGPTSH
jgi:hypothetical protein